MQDGELDWCLPECSLQLSPRWMASRHDQAGLDPRLLSCAVPLTVSPVTSVVALHLRPPAPQMIAVYPARCVRTATQRAGPCFSKEAPKSAYAPRPTVRRPWQRLSASSTRSSQSIRLAQSLTAPYRVAMYDDDCGHEDNSSDQRQTQHKEGKERFPNLRRRMCQLCSSRHAAHRLSVKI